VAPFLLGPGIKDMFHRYDIVDEMDLNASVAKLAAALATAQG
jgi:hypothetical protein